MAEKLLLENFCPKTQNLGAENPPCQKKILKIYILPFLSKQYHNVNYQKFVTGCQNVTFYSSYF